MKTLANRIAKFALAGIVLVSTANLTAQDAPSGRPPGQGPGQGGGRGNFDPAQMRQRMMERYRETLEIKGDDEWKLIEKLITNVTDARREVGFGGGGMFGRMGRPPGGGNAGQDANAPGQGQRGNRGFGGEPSPEAEALQKAIDGKASTDELKGLLAKYRDSRKAKEAKLQKAQDDLRKVLTVRQEAQAVIMGLLN